MPALRFRSILAVCLLLTVGVTVLFGANNAWADHLVRAEHAVVVTVSPPASQVGLQILQRGGNAVDAAVATAFALAVTFPPAGNIGGGGFMLVKPSDANRPVVIDYREVAPAGATQSLFETQSSVHDHKAVGVPGTVAGLALAHQRFGRLPWRDLVQPAVDLARDGFVLDRRLADSLNGILAASPEFAEFRRVYGRDQGRVDWQAGDRLVLPELAWSLKQIAEHGADGFYRGEVAARLVAEMKLGGGLISEQDLAGYRAVVREPLCARYREYDVYCPPPPAGGIVLAEMLNVLETFDLRRRGRWSAETLHLMIESMRRGFLDRATHLGDPAFVSIPKRLSSERYAQQIAAEISLSRAADSEQLAAERNIVLWNEGNSTTHFSIVDSDRMAVANTYTLEQSYGARVVVRGAGFLLNNEMGDFGWRAGRTDRKGTIGTKPNLVQPGKRMLSSQTPTIVCRDGQMRLVTGSPGGRTIINTVLQVVLNIVEFEMTPEQAVRAPRLHHQWLPDQVTVERDLAETYPEALKELRRLGHQIAEPIASQGDAHTIWLDAETGELVGVADQRRNGAAVGY